MYLPRLAVLTACIAMTLTGCSSSSGGSSGSGGNSGNSGTGGTLTIGLVTPLSGPSSSTFEPSVDAAEARFLAYKEDDGECADLDFDVKEADDQSTPQGHLAALQKLTQQDKAFTVLDVSPYFYGGSQFMTTQAKAVPLIGGGFDGAPEWSSLDNNLFATLPPLDNSSVTHSTVGDYFKAKGGAKLAIVAYDSPSASQIAEAALKSAEAAGLEKGYFNDTVPFGSTDVGAIVLGIINSGADVLQLYVEPTTSFSVVAGLKQAGYEMKSMVSAIGYGADLLASEPAIQAGQGVTFATPSAPIELNTPATQRLAKALQEHAGSDSGIPGFAQSMGWQAADLFLHGLELAGCDASSQEVVDALRADNTWDADGLYPKPRDFGEAGIDESCYYYVTLEGKAFVPDPDATPLCGGIIE